MSKKYSGFTFVEMIVSLGIWLFLSAMLLPMFTQIAIERKNESLKSTAQQMLNEELGKSFATAEEKTIEKDGVVYTIRSHSEEGGINKICVTWQDYMGRTVERCGYTKR